MFRPYGFCHSGVVRWEHLTKLRGVTLLRVGRKLPPARESKRARFLASFQLVEKNEQDFNLRELRKLAPVWFAFF